jgi:hypothetical protein
MLFDVSMDGAVRFETLHHQFIVLFGVYVIKHAAIVLSSQCTLAQENNDNSLKVWHFSMKPLPLCI